ncbi:MAG: hypothetical protein A3G93_08465 [Nitrospinae bacterium RIFCSPLOWO2_12_FULL_45_22]|nr:MAG: hypothetical protein A3G93_08465 [Nitrospinae bacterium RIFCSPLOWO2_12_FULL_45_22]
MAYETQQKLTRNQLRAIPYLVSCKTIDEAAQKARVSRCHIYKWLEAPSFKEELQRQRDIVTREALEKLKASITKAIDTLVSLLISDNENIKLRASMSIVDYTLKSIELQDLEKRVSILEEQLASKGRRVRWG